MSETGYDFEVIPQAPGNLPEEPPEAVLEHLLAPEHNEEPRTTAFLAQARALLAPGAPYGGWGTPGPETFASAVKVSGRGISLWMHRELAVIYGHLIVDLDDHLRAKGKSLARDKDDWGLAVRKVRGSDTVWSNHAWGKAADFNALHNPMASRLITEFTPGFIDRLLKTKYRGLIRWGGRYRKRKDAMHFEWVGTIAQARSLTAALSNPTPGHNHSRPTLRPGPLRRETKDFVADLQGHLNYAFRAYPKIAPLKVDGHFGERTEIRWREWCKRSATPVSSTVDATGWNRIHAVTKGARFNEHRKPF